MRDVVDADAVHRQPVDQKRLAVVLIGGQLDGAQRLAVKPLLERDEGPRSRFEDRVLHRGLDRLGARVAEDDAIVAAGAARQLARQLSGQRVSRALRVNRTAFDEQPLRFGHQRRMVMAEEQRPVPADEIQHRHFLAVAVVIQIVALPSVEDHADAQQVEQPAELRLDHLVEIVRPDRLHAGLLLTRRCTQRRQRREMRRPGPDRTVNRERLAIWRTLGRRRDVSWVDGRGKGRCVMLRRARSSMTQERGGPFETLESAHGFVGLLREAVDDAYGSILDETARAAGREGRRTAPRRPAPGRPQTEQPAPECAREPHPAERSADPAAAAARRAEKRRAAVDNWASAFGRSEV